MRFPALSVNISPASFLKYTTYPSKTVVSPMMTKIIGGAERSETADTIQHHTIQKKRRTNKILFLYTVFILKVAGK